MLLALTLFMGRGQKKDMFLDTTGSFLSILQRQLSNLSSLLCLVLSDS